MYHKMDLDYDILGVNEPIEVIEYKDDGYTKNYLETFKLYPLGYYMYFKEILEMNLEGVSFSRKKCIFINIIFCLLI